MPCINNCKKCSHSFRTDTEEAMGYGSYGFEYDDWFCNYDGKTKTIDTWVDQDMALEPPLWCPLKQSEIDMPQPVHKTYTERKASLRNAWGPTKWEDIQPGKVYHLPPVGNEKRKDVLVVSKTDFCLRVKELNKNNPKLGFITTIYKDTNEYYKFLVEHRIMDFNQYIDDEEITQPTSHRSYYPSM